MNHVKLNPERSRLAIIDRANDLLHNIEIDFNTVTHWNNRNPTETPIEFDPDGAMARIAKGLAEQLHAETKHKIPREEWINQIKKVAKAEFNWSDAAIEKTDWAEYAYSYFLDCTPKEAFLEDMSND